jgi:hypothetical protein
LETLPSQLPYLIGNLSILFFESLPDDPESAWTHRTGVSISEGGGRSGPPFFRPPPSFFGNDPERTTAGSETYSYKTKEVSGDVVSIEKSYRLISPKTTDSEDYYEIDGTGTWKFNRAVGMPESLTFKQALTVFSGNTTTKIPVSINYRRLSDQEWQDVVAERQKQAQEAKERLAEAQRKSQQPLTSEQKQKYLDDLSSEKLATVMRSLSELLRKSPKEPDPQLAAAIRSLLTHSNRGVQMTAERALKKWDLEGNIAASQRGSS